MGLFGFGKKKEEAVQAPACACGSVSGNQVTEIKENTGCVDKVGDIHSIKILGSGCQNCHRLLQNTQAAVTNMGLDIEPEYITDMEKVMTYGVMSVPALVVNEKVVSTGKVLKTADVEELLHALKA